MQCLEKQFVRASAFLFSQHGIPGESSSLSRRSLAKGRATQVSKISCPTRMVTSMNVVVYFLSGGLFIHSFVAKSFAYLVI